MEMEKFIKSCKDMICVETMTRLDKSINHEDVFVVWSCKTLQNCKALLATNLPNDQAYYEVTWNGDKKEAYFDRYDKQSNRALPEVSFTAWRPNPDCDA